MRRKVPAIASKLSTSPPVVKPELDIYVRRLTDAIYQYSKRKVLDQKFWNLGKHPWPNWKTESAPRGLWKEKKNHLRYFEWLGKILSIQRKEDWYNVSSKSLGAYGGLPFLKAHYSGSMPLAMKAIYPDHEWSEWLFVRPPTGIWEHKITVRRYFDWLGQRLNIAKLDDWYQISRNTIFEHRGAGLLSKYDGSFPKAIMDAYRDHKWNTWMFDSVPQGWWHDSAHQKEFLDFVAREENVKSAKDWYSITDKILIKHGGHRFVKSYVPADPTFGEKIRKTGLLPFLMSMYPEYDWQEWKSRRGTKVGSTQIRANQRAFFDWAAKKLNIDSLDGWYDISAEKIDEIIKVATAEVSPITFRRHQLSSMIMDAYPEHKWLEWRFSIVPKSFWAERSNQVRFFEWLGTDQLKLRAPEDWYNVSHNDIVRFGGIRVLQIHNHSIANALSFVFPEHQWELWKFQRWNNPTATDNSKST